MTEAIEIDAEKIRELVDGKVMPETKPEEIAVASYERALGGDLLIYVVTDFPVLYDEMNEEERGYFLVGYAFGQFDHKQLDQDRFKTGTQTTH